MAQTAEWREVFSTEDQTIYIDAGLMVQQGKTRMVTVKTNYAKPQTVAGKSYRSTRTVEFFSCERRRWGLKAAEYFAEPDLTGEVVMRHEFSDSSMVSGRVQPNTPADAELQFVCTPTVRAPR